MVKFVVSGEMILFLRLDIGGVEVKNEGSMRRKKEQRQEMQSFFRCYFDELHGNMLVCRDVRASCDGLQALAESIRLTHSVLNGKP